MVTSTAGRSTSRFGSVPWDSFRQQPGRRAQDGTGQEWSQPAGIGTVPSVHKSSLPVRALTANCSPTSKEPAILQVGLSYITDRSVAALPIGHNMSSPGLFIIASAALLHREPNAAMMLSESSCVLDIC